MIRKFFLAILLSLIGVGTSLASFLPDNNLHLQDTVLSSNITEDDFNQVLNRIDRLYRSVIDRNYNGYLQIIPRWRNDTVNASASRAGIAWTINMFGGLARRPEVTLDGFTLVACHEMGHHLGGYPFSSNWAANEGQADYFSTLSCARDLWRRDTENNDKAAAVIGEVPKALCDNAWQTIADQNLCYRSLLAGKSLGNLLAALRDINPPEFSSPDSNVVSETVNTHPAPQCRLDTFTAGALCDGDFDINTIPGVDFGELRNSPAAEGESANYSCTRQQSTPFGYRPGCWFASQL